MLRQRSQQVDEYQRRLEQNLIHHFKALQQQSSSLSQRMNSLNPKLALKRGYAIVKQEGKIVSSSQKIKTGVSAEIEFHNGLVDVEIIGKRS